MRCYSVMGRLILQFSLFEGEGWLLTLKKMFLLNLRYLLTRIFVYRYLISKLAVFLFDISKDFSLLMRLPEFLMYHELIVPRRGVKIFAMAFDNLWAEVNLRYYGMH